MLILYITMAVLLSQSFFNFYYFYTNTLIPKILIPSVIYKVFLLMLLGTNLVSAIFKIWLTLLTIS